MIENEQVQYISICTDGPKSEGCILPGYVTLSCKGRTFKIDTGGTKSRIENGVTLIQCNVFIMDSEDMLGDSDIKFDLNSEDLLDDELIATIWIEWEEDDHCDNGEEITSITLTVNVDGTEREIDCTEE